MMHSFDVFLNYEGSDWHIRDLPWAELRPDWVRPEDLTLARAGVIGESNSIAALHNFLNESLTDYDFAAFASLWGYQELRHHLSFRAWLERVGHPVDQRSVETMRPAYPAGRTHAVTLATNLISELTVCHGYSRCAKDVREPVLRDLLTKAGRDESRHAREFLYFTRRRLAAHPDELASVLETLYIYTVDPVRLIKHPVSVFKGELAQIGGQLSIDEGFAYFLGLGEENLTRLRTKLFHTFSELTGHPLDGPASIRRALGRLYADAPVP